MRVICQGKSKQRRKVTGSYDSRSRHVLLEPSGDWLTPSEFAYKARPASLQWHARADAWTQVAASDSSCRAFFMSCHARTQLVCR